MSNWKTDMERKLQAQRDAEAQREAERRAGAERVAEQRQAKQARENAKLLATHQRRFKCHICGRPSDGPAQTKIISVDQSRGDDDYRNVYGDDWDEPINLIRCSVCNNWSCDDDIAQGVCKRDYEKGHLPGGKPRKSWW
jgi:hypothetical protein